MKFYELWCLSDEGIPLFYHVNSESEEFQEYSDGDSQLVSGLFSAIQTMAIATLNDSVSIIELSKSKLTFHTKDNITFIAKTNIKEPKTLVKKVLKEITAKFISDYKEILEDWLGNLKDFEKFSDRIEEYF